MGIREASVIFALSAAGRKQWPCIIDHSDSNGLLLPSSVCKLAQGLISKVGIVSCQRRNGNIVRSVS